jgi:hypothetical protein
MWFALSSAVGINGILALPVALFWGLVIMGIDRWLITSMPIDEKRKWAIAAPRVLLAILLGTLISTPLVLRVFESEINAQIAKIQTANVNSYLKTQASSQLATQINTYSTELTYLNTVIDSHGASTGNTAADPELVSYNKQLNTLNQQLTNETTLKAQYYKDYTCQKYGGADCPKAGVGPAAEASLKSYNQASAEVTKVQGEINTVGQEILTRNKQINDNSVAGQQNRYQQALIQQPQIQNEEKTAVQQQNQQEQNYYLQNQASHGILSRLEALSDLSKGNFTVQIAQLLLFLLFLVIECLPVTVKLLQKPGHYEAALARAKAAEIRDVEEYYADGVGGGLGQSYAAPAYVPSSVGPAAAGLASARPAPADETRRERRERRQAEEDRAAADVFSVWNPTKTMPRVVGDPVDEIGTQVIDQQARNESAFDFPPSESDPRTAATPSWGRSASGGQASGAQQGNDRGWDWQDDRTRQDASGWGQQASDISAMWTRQAPQVPETRMDNGAAAPVAGPAQASHEGDRSLHDALSDLDDDAPYSARTESGTGGTPLNWDDE